MRYFILFLLILGSFTQVQAGGIDFFHGTWAEALAKAEKEDKIIFVDAYASWCGPCKRMAKNVFTQDEVGAFYNKNFINMKLDMEKAEAKDFRKKFSVEAYPTLFYVDYDGSLIAKVKGGQKVESFLSLGKQALSKVDRSGNFVEEYEKGNRDPELVYNYVAALNKAGKPSLKIANEYIRSQKDLDTPENLKFLLEAAVQADSRLFDLMIERKDKIAKLLGQEAVDTRIETACQNTFNKALEYKSADLLKEAKSKMKKHVPSKATEFAIRSDLQYSKGAKDMKTYGKSCAAYAKKIAKGDPKELYTLATNMVRDFPKHKDCLKMAEKYAKIAAEKGDLYNYWYTYASILNDNGKKKEAKAAAEKSLEIAKEKDPRSVRGIQALLNRIEQS